MRVVLRFVKWILINFIHDQGNRESSTHRTFVVQEIVLILCIVKGMYYTLNNLLLITISEENYLRVVNCT